MNEVELWNLDFGRNPFDMVWCSRSRNRPREGSLAEVMNVGFVMLET